MSIQQIFVIGLSKILLKKLLYFFALVGIAKRSTPSLCVFTNDKGTIPAVVG